MTPRHPDVPARIWALLEESKDGCWVWRGPLTPKGYARTTFGGGKADAVHRFIYQAMHGPIPAGLVCDHLCRNRACANPSHIEPVTNAENLRRGNSRVTIDKLNAAKTAQTHCKRGHELAGDNLRPTANGTRQCRRCASDYEIFRRKAAREAAAKAREGGQ